MRNPFDPMKDIEKHECFRCVVEAIDKWMTEKYPLFDSTLERKINQLDVYQDRIDTQIREHKSIIENEKQDFIIHVTKQINEFLEKDYPDIDGRLKILLQKLEKNSQKVDEKLKKIISSESLYQDVYKMRDEFNEMKKFMESFSKKIKKAFEI